MIHVTAAIITHNNKILSVRRGADKHLAGYWEFPGGKLEQGETLEACLKRELEEELGINACIGDYVGQSTHDYGKQLIRLNAFMVPVASIEMTLTDHDKSKWLSHDELDDVEWAPADIPIVHQLKTYLFYRNNAEAYIAETLPIVMSDSLNHFIVCLPNNAKLLDVGCGSGRDTLFFKQQGYDVVATDMVSEMAASAAKQLSQEVLVRSCFNLGFKNEFDGVWASASLLHCPKTEFVSALSHIAQALMTGGVVYLSLKQGIGESLDNRGRYFSYYAQDEIKTLVKQVTDLSIIKLWLDESVIVESRLHNNSQMWINLLLRKGS
ncbi:MAG: NUDIX domain-containing protein [Pseudomonadota bacterium]